MIAPRQRSLEKCPCCLGRHESIHAGKNYSVDCFSTVIAYEYGMCVSCGHYFVSNPLDQASLDTYYSTSMQLRRLETSDLEKSVFEKQSQCIENVIPIVGKRILEIGCDTGQFLTYLKDHGVGETFYIESGAKAVRILEQETCHRSVAMLDADGVDVIVARHVLEHVSDPAGFISYLCRYLRSDGVMMIEVPDHSDSGPGTDAVIFEHLHHFSIASISVLLDVCELRAASIEFDRTEGYGTTENRVMRVVARRRFSQGKSRQQSFVEHFYRTNSALYRAVERLITDDGRVVALYAASWVSKDIIINSNLCADRIDGVYDSDPSKIGTDFLGFRVMAPESILASKVDTLIICSSYYKEIEVDIRRLGFEGGVVYYPDLVSQ